MHVIIWRFTAADPAVFERVYGREGKWAQLFRRSAEYVRTDLLTDGQAYFTLDWWTSRAGYDAFRKAHAEDYAAMDWECEDLTTSEELIGHFDEVAGRM